LAIKLHCLFLLALLLAPVTRAGGTDDGKNYTNFGRDLVAPIFPVNGVLNIYKNKSDAQPLVTLRDMSVVDQSGEPQPCIKVTPSGWVHCTVGTVSGWIKGSDFRSAAEYAPSSSWPFRYWLYVASPGTGSEDAVMLRQIVPKIPYLIVPAEFANIFFHVIFDMQGRAISPKTHKPTGDLVFLIGDAVYLAPADVKKRNSATWLFLNFYNAKLNALCPARSQESCMSAVNLGPGWPGIRAMYDEPLEQFRQKSNDEAWFGAGEVAFARHTDPVKPLMYRVPDHIVMEADRNDMSASQRAKNREKPFCIADCGKL
jgi:hypothetical protein